MIRRVFVFVFALLFAGTFLLNGSAVARERTVSVEPKPGATPVSQVELTLVTMGDERFAEATFAITVDAEGLIGRSDSAESAAARSLGTYLDQLPGCYMAFGLIRSGGEEQLAKDISALVAQTIILNFPEMVERATLMRFSLNDPDAVGDVELTLYFNEECRGKSAETMPG